MYSKTKIFIVIIGVAAVLIGAAYFLFAASGFNGSRTKNLPACDSAEAQKSLGCIEQ